MNERRKCRKGCPRLTALEMVAHVVHAREDALAAGPFALDARVVLGLVPDAVLLAAEAALLGLRAALVAAEVVLLVAMPVLAQIACFPHESASDALRRGGKTEWVAECMRQQPLIS